MTYGLSNGLATPKTQTPLHGFAVDLLWICCTTNPEQPASCTACCGFAVQQSTTGLWPSVIFVKIDLYNTTITVDCKSAAKKHFSQYHAWIVRYDKGLCLSVLGVARSPLTGSIS